MTKNRNALPNRIFDVLNQLLVKYLSVSPLTATSKQYLTCKEFIFPDFFFYFEFKNSNILIIYLGIIIHLTIVDRVLQLC